jgi:hypothetical protein
LRGACNVLISSAFILSFDQNQSSIGGSRHVAEIFRRARPCATWLYV